MYRKYAIDIIIFKERPKKKENELKKKDKLSSQFASREII